MTRVWLFLGAFAVMLTIALLTVDRQVRRDRLKPQKTHDPGVLLALRLTVLATVVTALLDTLWLHASRVPAAVSTAALALFMGGLGFALWAVRTNRFFMPAVRIQDERGHRVVDSGPYAIVRHPGYAAMLVVAPSVALALGSWLALVPALACMLTLVTRTRLEDRFLVANLPSYTEYAKRTKFRLIPGLW